MTEYGQLNAKLRTSHGKGVARQLRRNGLVPAVLYGRGGPSLSLTIDPHLFRKATDPNRLYNTLFHLTVEQEGGSEVVPCLVADIQTDAIKDHVMHVDFLRVDLELPVQRKVPVSYVGRAPGVAKGGKLKTFRRIVKVSAKPADFPEELTVDLSSLDAGESIRISDLSLPNATIDEPPDASLALVQLPKAKTEDDAAEEPKKGKK